MTWYNRAPVRSCEREMGASFKDIRRLQIFPTAPPGMPFQCCYENSWLTLISLWNRNFPFTNFNSQPQIRQEYTTVLIKKLICKRTEKNPDGTEPVPFPKQEMGASMKDIRHLLIFSTAPPGMPFQCCNEKSWLSQGLDKVTLRIFNHINLQQHWKIIQMRRRRWRVGCIPSPISPSRQTAMPRTDTPWKERRRTVMPRKVALKTETV